MSNLYFECGNGISGDMSVGALLDLGASRDKLDTALKSMGLDEEFTYKISEVKVNSIKATDFDVVCSSLAPLGREGRGEGHHHHEHPHEHGKHSHHHRNLSDVISIIDKSDTTENAKNLAKRIFTIVAEAESKVHGLPLNEVHFHEIGAIDSIADIVSFAVLFNDLGVNKVYFKSLTEGTGTVECQHGIMNVPVPAVCEIASKYKLPLKITDNEGEMITPTGAAIAAALYTGEKLPETMTIEKVGNGAGKRPYKNPVLRVIQFN